MSGRPSVKLDQAGPSGVAVEGSTSQTETIREEGAGGERQVQLEEYQPPAEKKAQEWQDLQKSESDGMEESKRIVLQLRGEAEGHANIVAKKDGDIERLQGDLARANAGAIGAYTECLAIARTLMERARPDLTDLVAEILTERAASGVFLERHPELATQEEAAPTDDGELVPSPALLEDDVLEQAVVSAREAEAGEGEKDGQQTSMEVA